MPFLNPSAIITRVYDLLRTDARTSAVNWYNGRRTAASIHSWPAGNVYLGIGNIAPRTMPAGEEGNLQVVVEIGYAAQESAASAEILLRDGLDNVLAVLVDNWDLGLSYAWPRRVDWSTTINPETTPPVAAAEIRLDVMVLPGAS